MSRFPNNHSFEYTPGRVVRKRELTSLSSFVAWLKNGLRPKYRRVGGIVYGLSGGSSLAADGGSRTITVAGDFADILLPTLYEGDRIMYVGVSALAAGNASITIALIRFSMQGIVTGSPVEVLESLQYQFGQAVRELKVLAFTPRTVESGYVYRIRVTAGQNNDIVYGGIVDVDHPKEG